MKVVVVGGGSWGTGFSCVLLHRGHEVTLACRDPEQAHAIATTGRNPRYLQTADLQGISASTTSSASAIGASSIVVAEIPRRSAVCR